MDGVVEGVTPEEALRMLEEEEERLLHMLAVIRAARAALSRLLSGGAPAPGPRGPYRTERVRYGRKTIAELLVGEDYVELRAKAPLALVSEVREYLASMEYELRQLSPSTAVDVEAEDGYARRITITGLRGVLIPKAKAILRNTAEYAFMYARAIARRRRTPP